MNSASIFRWRFGNHFLEIFICHILYIWLSYLSIIEGISWCDYHASNLRVKRWWSFHEDEAAKVGDLKWSGGCWDISWGLQKWNPTQAGVKAEERWRLWKFKGATFSKPLVWVFLLNFRGVHHPMIKWFGFAPQWFGIRLWYPDS